jgi:hypothetical protein
MKASIRSESRYVCSVTSALTRYSAWPGRIGDHRTVATPSQNRDPTPADAEVIRPGLHELTKGARSGDDTERFSDHFGRVESIVTSSGTTGWATVRMTDPLSYSRSKRRCGLHLSGTGHIRRVKLTVQPLESTVATRHLSGVGRRDRLGR